MSTDSIAGAGDRVVPSTDVVVPYSTWRNLKGGGLYTALGVSTCSTNGPREGKEQVVVYISHAYQRLRHRDVAEFLAKFVRTTPGLDQTRPPGGL